MPEGVTIQGFDQLNRALAQLTGPGLAKVTQRSALQIGHELVNKLQRYPKRPSHPLRWASAKSRRFYFAMRREKGLPAKYTRISDPMSQKLRQSWGVKRFGTSGAIAGNRATYAPLVQSSEMQTEMHAATGWVTDEQAVEALEQGNRIPKIVAANLKKFLKRQLGV